VTQGSAVGPVDEGVLCAGRGLRGSGGDGVLRAYLPSHVHGRGLRGAAIDADF
jgi:hypothetical protein